MFSDPSDPALKRKFSSPLVHHHDAKRTPPGRAARLHRRPSTRLKRRAQELFPRFQILGPARSQAPFRRDQIFDHGEPAIMEKHIFRSLHLPRLLQPDSSRWAPPPWRVWPRTEKSGVGFKLSLAFKFWTLIRTSSIPASCQSLFSNSTDSPPASKLSA